MVHNVCSNMMQVKLTKATPQRCTIICWALDGKMKKIADRLHTFSDRERTEFNRTQWVCFIKLLSNFRTTFWLYWLNKAALILKKKKKRSIFRFKGQLLNYPELDLKLSKHILPRVILTQPTQYRTPTNIK